MIPAIRQNKIAFFISLSSFFSYDSPNPFVQKGGNGN
jgi:hypothetical protein